MNKNLKPFFSFSVDDLDKAKKFYGDVLGLKVKEKARGGCGSMLTLSLDESTDVLIYPKKDHVPATFTILNFPVEKVEAAVKNLSSKGITFMHYDGSDELGIMHDQGPTIAWFKDPAGNFLSYIEAEEASMKDVLKLTHFIPRTKEEVFKYWTRPELFEQWARPDGMDLEVQKLEAKKGGKYVLVHTGKEGRYMCNGYFAEFIPDEKLIQIDTVMGPDGKLLFSNLECIVEFNSKLDGTEVTITQSGFPDEKSLSECEKGWKESLEKLSSVLNTGTFRSNKNKKVPLDLR